jgi:hypothetical protein
LEAARAGRTGLAAREAEMPESIMAAIW